MFSPLAFARVRASTFSVLVLAATIACGNGSGDDDGNDPGNGSLPDSDYCAAVSSWPDDASSLEEDILILVNQYRDDGADCGSQGEFEPAPPLAMNGALRCAARAHSADMGERGFFDHTNPDGEGPSERLSYAGYQGRTWGENIAAGNATAEATMQQWMNSPGHCANIMNPLFTEIGVGYATGGQWGHLWTQTFGG